MAAVALLSGCNTANQSLANRQEVGEIYHIVDFKTQADVAKVSRAAAANDLAQNTNIVQSSAPLQIGKAVPAEPGKFTLVSLASILGGGGGMGAMMQIAAAQNGSSGIKVAKCDGAVWTSKWLDTFLARVILCSTIASIDTSQATTLTCMPCSQKAAVA